MRNQEIVLDLGAIDASMLPLVGGKAANLGEMIRAGLPVPPGVCVTTEAYRLVAESAAGQNREALLAAPVPTAVSDAIAAAYQRLGDSVPVAVRSSATAEDLPNASFAGQQDTYLHIVGRDAVLDAVRRCWASLWTDRAVVYRNTNGIDHSSVRLAVVIQRMIDSQIAGVLFTANPVTGRRQQAVIDASPGLGEAVVSGAVNPDHFVVTTATGEILERRLGDKRFEIRSRAGGGTEHIERTGVADRACVSDEQIRALAALGQRVENYFGKPQDIEWAIDAEGKLWLTQARPITTLFPLPASAIPAGAEVNDLHVYFCFSVAQGLNRPITPMGLAAFRLMATDAARLLGISVAEPLDGPPAYADAGQRLFVDLTGVLRGRVGRTLMPRMLDFMEARSAAILRSLSTDPRLSITRKSPWLFLRRVLRIAVRYALPMQMAQAVLRPEAARARVEKLGSELAQRLALPESATPLDRLDFAERVLASEVIPLGPRMLPPAAAAFALLGLAGKLLGGDATSDELQTVLRALPHNLTTEMDLELWSLAGRIRSDEESSAVLRSESAADLVSRFRAETLPEVAQRGVTEFLSRYGHRAVAEIDLGMPRWSDDPAHIFGVLANYLRLEKPELAPDAIFSRGAADAVAVISTLADRAKRRGRVRAKLVRFALQRARGLAGLRESAKYYMVVALAAARRELAEVGVELAGRGAIETADDVFFLDLKEARAGLKGAILRDPVTERRGAYQSELRRRHVPRVLLSDGTEPEAAITSTTSGDLSGTPASAGSVNGRARVILDPVGAHLEPGEILVAPSTDPGWTPLFLTAGGLVMEMGGANSHGAVVAREYGIPAVVGVADATTRIATGDRITVDGSAGTITLTPVDSTSPISDPARRSRRSPGPAIA